MPLDVVPASPFIVLKGMAQVTVVVRKGKKKKEKKVASGVDIFLLIRRERSTLQREDAMGVELLASPSTSTTCQGHALLYARLYR